MVCMGQPATGSGGVLIGRRARTRRARGFTLVELMLVMVIIGVLTSFAIPYFQKMTARARRTEAQMVLDKLRLYFINAYESNGVFPNPGVAVQPNPPVGGGNPPVGQASMWAPATPGWRDIPFSFEGGLKLRYTYAILSDSPPKMTITVVGDMPGLGPPISGYIPGVSGNYVYVETLEGTVASSIEIPAM